MRNAGKTKRQLINEFVQIRRRIAELEASEAKRKRMEEEIRASREKYHHLFENLNDAALLADAKTGQILETNRQGEVLLGMSRNEIVGMHQPALHPPGKAEEYKQRFATHVAKGRAADYEGEVVRKDGTIISVSIGASPLTIHGRPLILGLFRDITERKRMEEVLRDSQEKLRKMFESVTDGIIVIDLNGVITEVNQRTVEMHGFSSRDELLGKSAFELVAPCDHEKIAKNMRQALKQGIIRGVEYNLLRADGSEFPGELSTSVLKDASGNPVGHITIVRDITESKQAEEALRRAEQEKTAVLDSMNEVVLFQDMEHRLIWANKVAGESVGLSPEQLMGRYCYEIWHKRSKPCVGCPVAKARETGQSQAGEITTPDGRVWFVRGYPVRDTNGDIVGFVESALDITESKQAEETLRESQQFSSSLLGSSPNPISVINPDTSVRYVNPAFEKLTGFTLAEITGRKAPYPWWPEGQREEITAGLKNAMAHGGRRSERNFQKKSGERFWVAVNSAPVVREGKPLYFLLNWLDITERKQMEQMEEQLMMTERLASVGELASGIAHELNNPLTSVIGFSQLLMERDNADDIKEDLGLIYSEAQRAAGTVKNLLTFARKHSPVKQLSQINNVIEDVLKLRAYEQKVSNIEVDRRFASDLPEIMADYFQMQQVFLNLIINAEYFMTQAHNKGRLTITTERLDNIVRISLADDGSGISKENLSRIFNPFFTTKEVGKGTGLGLSICHGIVSGHGGSIYARSRLGKGATFVVELPVNSS
jgi:two-component system NtrC family sensor kinase